MPEVGVFAGTLGTVWDCRGLFSLDRLKPEARDRYKRLASFWNERVSR